MLIWAVNQDSQLQMISIQDMQVIYQTNIKEYLTEQRNQFDNFLIFDRRNQNKCYALTDTNLKELILFDDFKNQDLSSLKSKMMNQFLTSSYDSKKDLIKDFIIYPQQINILHFYANLNQRTNFEQAFLDG